MKLILKFLIFLLVIILISFRDADNYLTNKKLIHPETFVLKNIVLPGEMMIPIELQNIHVAGAIGNRINKTIENNLLKLDVKVDFLAPFRERDKEGGYIGIGKLIDASVKFAYYSQRPDVEELKKSLIKELIKTQEDDGYIGVMKTDARVRNLWDIHEMGYIILGMTTDYRYFKTQQSLNSAIKLANYIIHSWPDKIQEKRINTDLSGHMAMIGLDKAMLSLYQCTGDRQYIDFITNNLRLSEWDLDIVVGRKKGLEGHIYAYLARCLAQLELYQQMQDEKLLVPSTKLLKFITEQKGMLITGETGQWECWTDDQDGGIALGETCATAYQIRFFENLFRMKGDSWYGDIMERTIYNALFAAQSPDGRQIRYYTPLEGQREYFKGDTYCCPNNYRRIISELPSMIYYRYNGIAINLYTASEAKIILPDGNSVSVKQETDYPNSGEVKIIISPEHPCVFPICMRIPSWAKGSGVTVNNEIKLHAEPGSMFRMERTWSGHDTIRLQMPIEWRFVKGRERQAGRIAVMHGPVIYCLNPELNKGMGLEKKNSCELGRILIDPNSIKGPFPDDRLRFSGTVCRIGAWKEGHGLGGKYDYELILTEFIDPEGKAVYFNTRDMNIAVSDELFSDSY